MTDTMRASVLVGAREIRMQRMPIPRACTGQVLVRIAAVGVCGSDVHYYLHGRIGDFVLNAPMILGHEASGTIVEVGSGVSTSRLGERVAIEPQRPCRSCAQCKAGRYNLCPSIEFFATPPFDGAFAEFQVVDADFAFPIPPHMSLEEAALCEPLSVGIWANQKAGTGPASRILVAGAGPIGIVMTQVARAFGATEVVVSDPVPQRREAALNFGATRVVDPTVDDLVALKLEADAFIDASGAATAIRAGVYGVRPAGRVVLVGMGAEEVQLPLSRIQNRELQLTGVFRYANTWPLAVALASAKTVDLQRLVTDRFSLVEVEDALMAATLPSTMKALVLPHL